MGVKIGGDDAKSGKNTNLLVIMYVRLSQKISLHNFPNQNWFKNENSWKKHMKNICDYCGIHVLLHMRILLLCAHKCQPPVTPHTHPELCRNQYSCIE